MASQTSPQWQTIRRVHAEWADFYRDFGSLSLIGLFVLLGLIWFAADRLGYATNVYTEALSVIVTIVYLDRRAERRQTRALQDQLVREAGGRANDRAVAAIDHLRLMGWSALLRRVNFRSANLSGADLSRTDLSALDFREAELQGVNLRFADLTDAELSGANLIQTELGGATLLRAGLDYTTITDAVFGGANLSEAEFDSATIRKTSFTGATLQQADFSFARMEKVNFTRADLVGANLANTQGIDVDCRGAKLLDANLSRANALDHAIFDQTTRLPDGAYWTPDTDMSRYTDPDHPDFWQPDWARQQGA